MKKINILLLIGYFLITFCTTVHAESEFVVKNRIIEWLDHEVVTSTPIARENIMEFKGLGYFMSPSKISTTSQYKADIITDKMDDLGMSYSVIKTTPTAAQQSMKTESDGRFYTKNRAIRQKRINEYRRKIKALEIQ